MAKRCFFNVFSGFNVSVVCFLVCLVKMYKCYIFPVLGLWGAYCCLFGFGRFRCFVFFVFVFHLFRFCFCLNCSVLFCWWIVFGVVFFFFFWGGGGVLHLFFCCLFCFVCVGVFWSCLVFVFLYIFGLFLCCSLCFLEWSRCCYCFVFLVCFACISFYVYVFVSFCFLWTSLFSVQF